MADRWCSGRGGRGRPGDVYEDAAPLLDADLASINDDRANIFEGDEDAFDEVGGREASRASIREYAPLLQGAYCDTPGLYAAAAAAAAPTLRSGSASPAGMDDYHPPKKEGLGLFEG